MRIRLAYKIFGAFLLTCLTIIVLMTGIIRYFAERHFTEYVNRLESETLSETVDRLGAAYREHKGWAFIREDPRTLRALIRAVLPHDRPSPPDLPGPPEGQRPPEFDDDRPRDISPPRSLQHHITERIALFDDQMHLIAGSSTSNHDPILKAIAVDGQVVGWLGLSKRKRLSGPGEKTFLREQSQAFFVIGAVALVLAALVSWLLSRHLLRPVEQLAQGAHALASRRFDTRIPVASGDELGQLADDFNHMAGTLERYEQLRRQWLTDIAHELRTPVAILQGEIEAVQDGVRELRPETLESLHAEILFLGKLIGDLHELSTAQSGELSMEIEPVRVLEVLKNTLRLFEARLTQKGIAMELDLGEDMDITVMADSDRLAQVFSNILENTLRYTEAPGTVRIWQGVTAGFLRVNIEDSKPGVSDEALGHLFDRLYRCDPARSRLSGGSGLGLAIAKGMVEMFQGEIHASHASLGGVHIEISLPLSAAGQ